MPTMTYSLGGSYVKITGSGMPPTEHGKRGQVKGFSRASRKRLMDWLNAIDRGAVSVALFVTLTYPSTWPDAWQVWKRHLDTFLKRFKRQFPSTSIVWRLEFQKRGAPHFHLLVFGVERVDAAWLSQAWYEIVGSGDEKHLKAGTQVQAVRDFRGVLAYASKYIGKASEDAIDCGRIWGVIGREVLPVRLVQLVLPWADYFNVRRLLRRWVQRHAKHGVRYRSHKGAGLTAYLPAAGAWQIVVSLGGDNLSIYSIEQGVML